MRNRFVALCLLFSMSCLLVEAGCSPEWKKKFIRKSKNAKPPQPVFALESNFQSAFPPDVLYREHFAYWKSWHTELLASLGQSRKRDVRYLSGAVSELRSMVGLLSGPPADHLKAILEDLGGLETQWARAPEPWFVPSVTRSRLERIRRQIDKQFSYSKVKSAIPTKQGTQGEGSQTSS